MAEVAVQQVVKRFGTVEVLHGIDATVENGEFVVLVGPSGCGKSTLLRMIAGLEDISSGTISIGGRVVNQMRPKERDIAMVFQSYALYPHMTVRKNMGFSLKLAGVPKDEIERAVNRAAGILGLDALLDRKPRQLSGGQRQRVAMGRAIVRNPQVFLFDEPLSNLDAQLRVQMRGEIRELHQRLKATTVYVTHDQIEAMTMADKIVVMRDGRVEQIGRPLELYDRPGNRFVASFIGSPSMNFFEGVVEAGGRNFVAADGSRIPLPEAVSAPSEKVILGVRPEHLSIVDPSVQGSFPGTVLLVERTGSETIVTMMAGGQRCCAVSKERLGFSAGTTVGLLPSIGKLHFFTAEMGQRINRPFEQV